MISTTTCPCQSGSSYDSCCGQYHSGALLPETAETLMRSRYCAFVLRLRDFLVHTTHPEKLTSSLPRSLESTFATVEWTELRILSRSLGQSTDKVGKVKFEAAYTESGILDTMVEHSRFRKHAGKWYYYDANG